VRHTPLALLLVVAACGGSPQTAGSPDPTHSAPPTTVPVGIATDDIVSSLDTKRQSFPAPGALAVVAVDGQRASGSSGAADIAGTPITAATRFRMASITKPITAALVLDAVERGELSLDDRVDDLVPGLLTAGPPVTVRQLLQHTSGIFDETNNDAIVDDIALLTDETDIAEANELLARYTAGESVVVPQRLLVALAEAHGRDFPAGTAYEYSNLNFQVAAIVLETVTGRPFSELLRDRIVEPLGLDRTTIAPPDVAPPEFRGYGTSVDDGSLVDVTDDLSLMGNGGAGGIITTADELLTMLQAINRGELFDTQLLTEMRTPTDQSGGTYGLGLARYQLTCGTFWGHEGGVNGTASIAMVAEDGSDGVVVAFNLRDGSDPRLAAFADDLMCPVREGNE
jgi:D-alanyl-D-alanine carboxypeptidase